MKRLLLFCLLLTVSSCIPFLEFYLSEYGYSNFYGTDIAPCEYYISEGGISARVQDDGPYKALIMQKKGMSQEDTVLLRKDNSSPAHAHFYFIDDDRWLIRASSDTSIVYNGPHIVTIEECTCLRYGDEIRHERENQDFADIIDRFEEGDIRFQAMMYYEIGPTQDQDLDIIVIRGNTHNVNYKPSPNSFGYRLSPINEK